MMGRPAVQAPPAVSARHLEAAQYLYERLPEWNQTDEAFRELRDAFPGFLLKEVFVKVAAVVGLYGIQRLSVPRMAVKLTGTLKEIGTREVTAALVENEIAPLAVNGRQIRYRSFASKFAHFFLQSHSGDCVPIYDQHSVRLVAMHSGRSEAVAGRDYVTFAEAHATVRNRNGLTCTNKQLDQYLWMAGVLGKGKPDAAEPRNDELRLLLARDAEAQRVRDVILGD